jgi:hypothetical protein
MRSIALIFRKNARHCSQLKKKGLVACDVPVEDVELVVGHGADDLLDGGHRDEVPGRVDEQATVRIGRLILNLKKTYGNFSRLAFLHRRVNGGINKQLVPVPYNNKWQC